MNTKQFFANRNSLKCNTVLRHSNPFFYTVRFQFEEEHSCTLTWFYAFFLGHLDVCSFLMMQRESPGKQHKWVSHTNGG